MGPIRRLDYLTLGSDPDYIVDLNITNTYLQQETCFHMPLW